MLHFSRVNFFYTFWSDEYTWKRVKWWFTPRVYTFFLQLCYIFITRNVEAEKLMKKLWLKARKLYGDSILGNSHFTLCIWTFKSYQYDWCYDCPHSNINATVQPLQMWIGHVQSQCIFKDQSKQLVSEFSSANDVMATDTDFWNTRPVNHIDYVKKSTAITGECYSELLNRFYIDLEQKRPRSKQAVLSR